MSRNYELPSPRRNERPRELSDGSDESYVDSRRTDREQRHHHPAGGTRLFTSSSWIEDEISNEARDRSNDSYVDSRGTDEILMPARPFRESQSQRQSYQHDTFPSESRHDSVDAHRHLDNVLMPASSLQWARRRRAELVGSRDDAVGKYDESRALNVEPMPMSPPQRAPWREDETSTEARDGSVVSYGG